MNTLSKWSFLEAREISQGLNTHLDMVGQVGFNPPLYMVPLSTARSNLEVEQKAGNKVMCHFPKMYRVSIYYYYLLLVHRFQASLQ